MQFLKEVEMDRKNYIDIENLREHDIDLGNGSVRLGNAAGFAPGDQITITEKFDGSMLPKL